MMSAIIEKLKDKDDRRAYEYTKNLVAASEFSAEYYPLLEEFASLLDDEKSYVRTRAFILCCSQARWDEEGKLKELLPGLLMLFHDPKPAVVRQSLKAIKEIVVFRPELSDDIRAELNRMDLSSYKESMSSLIALDMADLKELIDSL